MTSPPCTVCDSTEPRRITGPQQECPRCGVRSWPSEPDLTAITARCTTATAADLGLTEGELAEQVDAAKEQS